MTILDQAFVFRKGATAVEWRPEMSSRVACTATPEALFLTSQIPSKGGGDTAVQFAITPSDLGQLLNILTSGMPAVHVLMLQALISGLQQHDAELGAARESSAELLEMIMEWENAAFEDHEHAAGEELDRLQVRKDAATTAVGMAEDLQTALQSLALKPTAGAEAGTGHDEGS